LFPLNLIQALQDLLLDSFGHTAEGRIITNTIMVIVTVLFFWLVYWLVFRIFKRASNRVLGEQSRVGPLRIQKQEILSAQEMSRILNGFFLTISWLLRVYIVLAFVNTVLALFDWSRDVAETLARQFGTLVGGVVGAIVDYLPDLFTALVIIAIAYGVLKLFRLVFEGIERQRIKLPHFYPEWSKTSYSLIRLLVIALTLVVVFPYLPGSGSPAFQGVSIFFGVLLSLGSTSAVANVVAGIVITYTRAFKAGDWVSVAGAEGKIFERTAFVTRIRTAKNVEISVPNSAVMSDKVINFSSQARNVGITLHTSVTIGYDVPWPTVQKLLLAAAAATDQVEPEPAPFVLQTALEDNYVAYELNVFTKNAGLRPKIYSELHANILDAFHGAGIEITSPHYRAVRDGNPPAIAEVITPEPGEETKKDD
jgi:small-conductance mechanosensitive channel